MQNIFELTKFTPSMLTSYLQCPLAFYYQYIAQIKLPTPQIHFAFGSAIHEAIDAMYQGQNVIESFKQSFDITRLLDNEKTLYDEYLKLGIEMLTNYLKEHEILSKLYDLNDGNSELYIKRKLINPLTNEESSLPMSGRIDRLTKSGIIIDYKTSKNKWNPDDISSKLQTDLYNLWYFSEYKKVPKDTLYIILLKKDKKVGKGETMQVISKHTTIDELASTFVEVEIMLQKIRNREFDRPSGYHPKWCDCFAFESRLNLSVDNKNNN